MKGLSRGGKMMWLWIALIVASGAGSIIQFHTIDMAMAASHSDLMAPVVGTREALAGKDPYSRAVFEKIQRSYYGPQWQSPLDRETPQPFIYPAMLIPLLAPIVHLSWGTIRMGFLGILPFLLVGSGLIWARIVEPEIRWQKAWVIALLFLCSWPAFWGLRLQQPTLPVEVLVALACWCFWREWDLAAGCLMAVLMIKPQIALPLALWMAVWTLRRKRWGFTTGFSVVLLGLLAVTESMVPGWWPHWLHVLGSVQQRGRLLLEILWGKVLGLASTAALGAWSVWVLYRRLRVPARSVEMGKTLALALAATLLVAPTMMGMIYNDVFLLPAAILLWNAKPQQSLAQLTRAAAVVYGGWIFASVIISGPVELVWPPFVNLALSFRIMLFPLLILVAILALLDEENEMGEGLKRLWRRGQERVEVDRSEASVGMLRRVPYTIRAD